MSTASQNAFFEKNDVDLMYCIFERIFKRLAVIVLSIWS